MALEVHVVTPEREVWSGEAEMVTARGVEGDVGILTGHAPLLVRLAVGWLHIRRGGEEIHAVCDGGFLHVSNQEGVTRVDVLASHAELHSEIDVAAARRRAEELERRLADHDDARVRKELAKALTRLNFPG